MSYDEERGTLTEEEIDKLAPLAEEAAEEYEEFREEKIKEISATREFLINRKTRQFPLKVAVDEETVLIFKVRRMTESERSKFNKINNLKFTNIDDLTPEDLEEINQQSYEIMSEVVVEPKMTVDEWKEVADVALLNHLSQKVAMLSTEVNDAKIITEFKKK